MSDTVIIEATDEIITQLAEVRRSGETNMLSIDGVQLVANSREYHAIVVFCGQVQAMPRQGRGHLWMQTLQRMSAAS
jgi:phosphoheptose isomerase